MNRATTLQPPDSAPIQGLVIVTLDSCRYDSAKRAAPEFLNSLATLRAARAHATFTLPAHVALFNGFFPLAEPDNSSPAVLGFVPRLRREGKPTDPVRGTVEGRTWVEGLRTSGWHTVGAAGMRWFKSDQLREGFDDFVYRGPTYSLEDRDIPAWSDDDFVLSDPEVLSDLLPVGQQWLLFVNAAETHSPYMCSAELLKRQRASAAYRNGKLRLPETTDAAELMRELHHAQVEAVRVADARIRTLFERLPRPFAFVVTADHGEAFGEGGFWGHVFNAETVTRVPLWEGVMH